MPNLTCYKYRSGSAALRALSEGTAYFASPTELNDTLEAKFDLAGARQFAEVFNTTLNELARNRGFPYGLKFAKPVPDGLEEATRKENERFSLACKEIGVYSAAPRPDNQPMWAYYCDNHRGVCFHLEWSNELMKEYGIHSREVAYTREARFHNRADDLREAMLELGQQNPTWSMAQIEGLSLTDHFRRDYGIRSVARAVSTKHADWEHEREIRLLRPRAGPIPVMQLVLKTVIFTRTDFPEWGSLMMLLHKLYPNTGLAQLTFNHKEPFVETKPLQFHKIQVCP